MAAGQLRPLAEAGPPGHVNRELIKAMGELGLLARLFPVRSVRRFGCLPEAPAMELCLLREALATQSTEAETALALQGLGAYPILQSGQEARSGAGCPPWPPGTPWRRSRSPSPRRVRRCGAEPAGRAGRRRVAADREKTWISNAPEADFYTVFARTTPGAGARGVSAFAVPATGRGCTASTWT